MTTAFPILEKKSNHAIPITALSKKNYAAWLKKQPAPVKNWLADNHITAEVGKYCLLPGKDGSLERVVAVIDDTPDVWSLAGLSDKLPAHTYCLDEHFPAATATRMTLGWALGSYRFTRYKKSDKKLARLVAPEECDFKYVQSMARSIFWARDLINTPANDMNPETLAEEAVGFAHEYGGKVSVVRGEALLKANWPLVYAVGKASSVPPHLVDIRLGKKGAPKVTLVGKGVCFDSGGLDLKPSSNMRLMKKDMAGVAILMALARVIMETGIDLQLRLILPIVENAVGGNATRPLDIVKSRKGITVEIGNTDAEGRLILCDALYEADEEEPDLLIDCTTLTGAARVGLGLEIPAFFTSDDELADEVMRHSRGELDPVWRLPLWKNYRAQLDTPNADLSNDPDTGYGGAITAALYLKEFVAKTQSWVHIDMMAWNMATKPGRPQGGEAMAIRALYAMIWERYGT